MMPNNGDGGSSEKLCGGGDGGVVQKKGPWTAAEDSILMEYVRQHGEGNWNAVQKNTGLARCGKSCRLRWANHLRPNLKKGSFTPEEERLIVELHSKLGNKWARMASQLPGRTDNEIKNYWNTRIKRRQRQGLSLYPSDIFSDHRPSATTSSTPTTPSTPTTASTFPFFSPTSRPPLFDPSLLSTSSRIPPLLATPLRYTRRRDSSSAASSSFYFPVSLSPPSHLPHSLSTSALSHLGSTNTAFQLSYDPNLTHSNSYSNLRTQFEFDNLLLPSSGYNLELPSSQMFSSQPGSEITFDPKVNASAEKSNSGLLEDLLEEAHTLGCRKRKSLFDDFEEESPGFDVFGQWDASSSVPSSSGANPNGEPADHVNSMSVHEDFSKLLNFIPSSMHVHDWYGVSEDISVGQCSVVTEDSKGLEMKQIASFLPVASTTDHDRTPGSCPWDNLPGIC